jgi:hypothetical protein
MLYLEENLLMGTDMDMESWFTGKIEFMRVNG